MEEPRTCPRCGRELVPLADLAHLASCAAVLADRVRDGLANMKLCIPQRTANAVRELATTTAPRLAQGLACAAGVCFPPAAECTDRKPLLTATTTPGPEEA